MYGTVGRAHVRAENRDRLAEVMMNPAYAEVPGYRRGYLMFPENRDNEVLIVAVFEDRDAYVRNADDPAQHQRYLEYRPCSKTNPSGPTASGWRRRRGAGKRGTHGTPTDSADVAGWTVGDGALFEEIIPPPNEHPWAPPCRIADGLAWSFAGS